MTKEWKYLDEIKIPKYKLIRTMTIIILYGTWLMIFGLITIKPINIFIDIGAIITITGLLGLMYVCLMFLQFEVEVPNE